jgi:glyoxylase-like metal-dependent hydrolase (beta-lactamase superfamily II)
MIVGAPGDGFGPTPPCRPRAARPAFLVDGGPLQPLIDKAAGTMNARILLTHHHHDHVVEPTTHASGRTRR